MRALSPPVVEQVDHAASRIHNGGHRQRWTHVAPDGAVVRTKLQAALQVVFDANVQLHATIQVAGQHINLAGARPAFAWGEGLCQGLAQGIDVTVGTVQHRLGRHMQPPPGSFAHLGIGTHEGFGVFEPAGPVGQRPQGPFGIAGVVLKVIEHRFAQRHRVAQSLDAARVRHGLDAQQFAIDAVLLPLAERLQRLQDRLVQDVCRLRPVCALRQRDATCVEVKLPAARRDLTNKISIIQGCHGCGSP